MVDPNQPEVTEDTPRGPVISGIALLVTAGWVAWRPVETFPWSGPLVAAIVLIAVLHGRQRTTPTVAAVAGIITAAAVVSCSGLLGGDPAAAVGEAALLFAVAGLVWLASRGGLPGVLPALLALAMSGLAVWGVVQVNAGPEHHAAVLAQVPEAFRADAAERLAAGRAFASQPLPSHLAVLLATALPLLLARVRRRWSAAPWAVGALLCVIGLAVTRSPIGIALALAACAGLVVARRRRVALPLAVALAVVLAAVVGGRGDVLELEPVRLRVDNWRSAVWIWSQAPAAGVGFGGFGQAAQTVQLEVGNRPRHAHSLPLEWLAELGPVGFAAAIMLAVWWYGVLREVWPRRPDLAVAAAVIPAHNLVDFSIYGSGVALPWAVLAGWTMAARPAGVRGSPARRGRMLVVVSATAALACSFLHATSHTVEAAAVLEPSASARYHQAMSASRIAPWRTEPLAVAAVAALESRDPELITAAASAMDRGLWLKPRSASAADLRAHLAEALGHAPAAISASWHAARSNPFNPTYAHHFERLVLQLDGSP